MYLFHNAPDYLLTPVILTKGAMPILCAMVPDAEGRVHRIPANIPWEVKPMDCMDVTEGSTKFVNHPIPVEKVARLLCDNGRFYGLVIVPEIRNGLSIDFDVASAAKESTRLREQAETDLVDKYVATAKQEQMQGRPIRPPAEPLQRILDNRKLDLLRDYGIQPVGYKVSDAALARDKEIAALKEANLVKDREIAEMKEMLAMLLEDKENEKKKKKVPQPVQA